MVGSRREEERKFRIVWNVVTREREEEGDREEGDSQGGDKGELVVRSMKDKRKKK